MVAYKLKLNLQITWVKLIIQLYLHCFNYSKKPAESLNALFVSLPSQCQ